MTELVHLDHRSLMQFSFLMMLSVSFIISGYILTGNRTRNIFMLFLANLVYTVFFFTVSMDIAIPIRRFPEVVAFLDLTAVMLWIVSLHETVNIKYPFKLFLGLSVVHLVLIELIRSLTSTVSLLRMTTSLMIVFVLVISLIEIKRSVEFRTLESYKFTAFTLLIYTGFKLTMGLYRVISHNFESGVMSIETSINVFTFLSLVFAIWLNFSIMFLNYDMKRNEVERLSMFDHLTKLPNRKLIDKEYSKLKDVAQSNDQNFAIALMDIDDFKLINDLHGHNIGDEVLRDFSECMAHIMRDSDFIARYGGEEFLIIMAVKTADEMYKTVERILNVIRSRHYSTKQLSLTASLGSVFIDHNIADVSLNEITAIADKHLYEAKASGKNRSVCGVYGKID